MPGCRNLHRGILANVVGSAFPWTSARALAATSPSTAPKKSAKPLIDACITSEEPCILLNKQLDGSEALSSATHCRERPIPARAGREPLTAPQTGQKKAAEQLMGAAPVTYMTLWCLG